MSENESRREGFSVKMQIISISYHFWNRPIYLFQFLQENRFYFWLFDKTIIWSFFFQIWQMNIQSLFPCLFDLTFVFFYFSVKKLVNCKDWNLMNWTSQKKIVEVDLSREDDYLSLWHLKQFQACVVIIILSWKFNSQGGLPKIWAFFLSKQFLPVYYFECWFSA